MTEIHFYKPEVPQSIWIDRGPNGGWMFRPEKHPNSVHQYVPADHIEALAAENERLREALKTIAKNDDFVTEETPIRPQWSKEQCSSIARAALGETQ